MNEQNSQELKKQYIWAFLRLGMALILLWAFFDKLFGLGFATESEQAWLKGTSPTSGYLKFGTHGPFASVFQGLAGNVVVDWLFMLGLLLVGLSLLLGIGVKVAGYAGALMMFLMWLSAFPPEHHPFLDEHVIYLLVLLGLTAEKSGRGFGLGTWWSKTRIVKKFPVIE